MLKNNHTLMMVATLGSFGLLVLLIFFPLPDKNAQTFLALASFVMGFYFGSSVNKQPVPVTPPAPTPTTPLTMGDIINQAAINAATNK